MDLTVSGRRQIFLKKYMSGGGKGRGDRESLVGVSSGALLRKVIEKVLYEVIFEHSTEGSE